MSAVLQDLWYGVRGLRRSPAFTVGAVSTLAFGIAAVAAVLTLGQSLLRRPPPVEDVSSLVVVSATRSHGRDLGSVSYPDYVRFRDGSRTLADLAAHYATAPLWTIAGDRSQEINGSVVTANYFRVLRLQPALGRFFRPDEDAVPDRDRVAVLSHHLWREWFNASPDTLGTPIRINGIAFTVVGVAPAHWQGLGTMPVEIYIPVSTIRTGYRWCDALIDETCTILDMVGRLAREHTVDDVRAEMATLVPQAWTTAPEGDNSGVTAFHPRGAHHRPSAEEARSVSLLLLVTAVLLLVCCANVAGLTMARSTARGRELAIRASLGASRRRLVSQLMTESLLVALAGGAASVILSLVLMRVINTMFYRVDVAGRPLHFDFTIDFRIVAAVLGVSVLAAVVFGLVPALRSMRAGGVETLASALAASSRSARARWLVAAQAGVAVGLSAVAVLLAASAWRSAGHEGLDPSRVIVMRLRPRLLEYPPTKAQAFLRAVVQRLDAHAAVESVTLVGLGGVLDGLETDVALLDSGERGLVMRVGFGAIGPRYFGTLGITVLRGREFNIHDLPETPSVAIVNQTLALRLWPNNDVIGGWLMVEGRAHQIVGVVSDAPLSSRGHGARPYVYTPFWQNPQQVDARLAIRVRGVPEQVLPLLVREVSRSDADVPVSETVTLPFQIAQGTLQPVRLAATVFGYAASVAALLCVVGLYAMLALAVTRRTKEMGLRLALGATPGMIRRLILREATLVLSAGVLCGFAIAMAGARVVGHLLYQPAGNDIANHCTVAAFIFVVGFGAAWIPARRAGSVMPAVALRHD